MIQCRDCEHFVRGPGSQAGFSCDPFSTIKEPECLVKWQLIKLDMMVQAYQATVEVYRKLAPLQEKMIRHMEREMKDIDEADSWKTDADDGDDPTDEDDSNDDARGGGRDWR
ncbi:MAG: hypothetical protein KA354_13540 [Phycisphaerae bacterium]|nr:hypothetical protein [Phycisphaerae bacterium]